MSGRLDGKKAFVLGAASQGSIGEAIARRFLAEGARVVIGGRDGDRVASLARAMGADAVTCDLLDEASIAAGVAQASETMDGLSIAVNVAGVHRSKPVAEENFDDLLAQARVHFVGPTLFIRYAAEQMTAGGSIVTTSSVTVELTGPGLAAYAGSKAAMDKVVRVAAVEYGGRGIRVNSLAPGLTRTSMTDALFDNGKLVEAFQRETPLGRLSGTDDVAAAALWLASDECTATGDLVRVSGGAHLRRLPGPHDMR